VPDTSIARLFEFETKVGNAILGGYNLSETNHEVTTTAETEARAGGSSTQSLQVTDSAVLTQTGNDLTGGYGLSQRDTTTTTLGQQTTSGAGEFTLAELETSTAVATAVGNAVTGLDLQTTTVTSSSSTTEAGSDGQGDGYQLTQTETSSAGRTQVGNDVSGAFAQQDAGSATTTLAEVGLDPDGGFTIVQTSADSSSQQETGNSVSGAYSLTLYLTQGYSLAQTDTARPGLYTITETGTAWTVRQETGSALDGSYQATATGSDQYTLSETGFEGNVNSVSSTLTGVDSSMVVESGNALTGDLSSTQTGQGGVSGTNLNGSSVSFTVQESSNALAGGFTLAETGTDRYDLLPQFNNPAGDPAPSTELFSGEGPAYGLGPVAGVSSGGGAVETGGSSAEGAATVRATGYDDGSGRMARVRAAATAMESATDPNAGAAQQQVSAELGAEIFKKYCFAGETPIETGTGGKAISEIRAGEYVWSAPERDPEAPAELKLVEEVFSNFTRVIRVQVGGRGIRTTTEHPFYSRQQGWVPAGSLRPGDLCRSRDGQWVAVEKVEELGEETEVYNLRIADFHTYFVGRFDWGFSVWAHNVDGCLQELAGMIQKALADSTIKAVIVGKSTGPPWKDVGRLIKAMQEARVVLNGGDAAAREQAEKLESSAKELQAALELADRAIQLRAAGQLNDKEESVVAAVEAATQALAKTKDLAQQVMPQLTAALQGSTHPLAKGLQKTLGEVAGSLQDACNTLPGQFNSRLATLAKQLTGDSATAMNAAILGRNLNNPNKEGYYASRPPGVQACHLVPSGDWSNNPNRSDPVKEAIADSQEILEEAGIDINDARNGFWATGKGGQLGSHKNEFFLRLAESLREPPSRRSGPHAQHTRIRVVRSLREPGPA
jgi:hypothetical protein